MRVRTEDRVRSLFLHWGPGANAEVERRWFANGLGLDPAFDIDWWDQPQGTGPDAFQDLTAAAKVRLSELCEAAGGPIHLIAHSFGGKIAQSLLESSPEKISGLTLLSCGSDPWKAFIHLATHLPGASSTLKQAAQTVDRSRRFEDFMNLAGLIIQVPDFQDHYWRNDEARSRYKALSQGLNLMSMESFVAVMKAFEGVFPDSRPIRLPAGFKSECYLGAGDPLQNPAEEALAWKRILPGCEVQLVPNAGHFVHFEADPSIWLPNLTSSFRSGK